MNIIPIKELKNTLKIEKICKSSDSPLFVTKNGYGSLVIMDIDYYSNMISEMEEAKLILEALEDVKNNKYRDGDEVIKGLEEKYGL
ncbi:type II toxin-antitoxin system Phd/YefM family antitoxin [Oceanivirga miroungae]|uniref:Prevent-host-death family protein n=1 Tax=Oceanivirga miroungae TaxID=1130046 RepID=A0A6I8M884_9FUSO|nr:type II toxin-antitoxin system Phd/YefM family antitoxin [Oceanivirga miroungae]VWL85013.1 prevent-host-death family protein [Oceanivirga miroungae]